MSIKEVITFDKSALKDICKILGVPYSKNIIAFTKKGVLNGSLAVGVTTKHFSIKMVV